MNKKICFGLIFLFLFVANSFAGSEQQELKEYLNNIAKVVKTAETPEEKREILNENFEKILNAAEYVEEWPLFSDKEKSSISVLKKKTQDKYDELNGYNGFTKVADADLDRFADYTVQELEQAAEYVTISVVTLVLIILLVAVLL